VRGAAYAIGLDFGHNHVRIAVCDLGGEPVIDDWSPAEVDYAPVESLDLAHQLVRQALEKASITPDRLLGIGMGIAAPVNSVTGTIESEGILPGWHGIRPAEEMENRLGLPVQIENDANLGALGELEYGCAVGAHNVVYVRLSAGIGAGLILDGRPYHGATGIAGEVGHVFDDQDGLICRCGNRGCLETVASPLAIASLLSRSRGEPVSVQQLLDLIEAGDRGAHRAVADACAAIGRAIAGAVNLLNPELVVIGGDLAAAGDTVIEPIREAIQLHSVPPASGAVQVVPGALGDRAEVLGAAALILTQSPRTLVQSFEAR
jgi:predicted NBD/HSP70 family sugar kinase